ncbi:hypothetical protein HYFRA_00005305 [Hymenoscyphus fraxineus]|uniref:Uncharacterized protein n=1 Tax=Hymenoscyphus fraxineus TaxID=746836 RepID=A0A9N9LDG1_9HELO|nr:hypothetical protein HYFRA_00005305 [Hymenoscyphus fraxineus]
MGWLEVATSAMRIFSYLLLPLNFLYQVLLIVLAPLIHLGGYVVSVCLLPLKVLAKFETVYIYLGIAALVGLVTGSILHLSSSALISLLNLTPEPEGKGRSAASVRAAREKRMLEDAWDSSVLRESETGDSSSSARKQTIWLDRGRRGKKQDLLRQTILEEDDDSGDF